MDDIESLVSDCISIEESSYQKGVPVIRGTLLMDSEVAFKTIRERLKELGLFPVLRKSDDKIELKIGKTPIIKEEKKWVNLLLLIATIFTTILAGSFLSGKNPFKNPSTLISGIPFSFTLLLILGSHELGHYFACKFRGIKATLPYFLPVPPPILPLGTFGAVIRIKSPISNKKELVEVGAAGPIIGFILAIPITIIGLRLSKIMLITPGEGQIFLGNSLLFYLLSKLFVAPPPPGYDLALHPVAFSGWVGMFITALNLLPLGQLDGGHIAYALLGKNTKFIAWPLIGIMIGLGIYWQGWLLWVILIVIVLKLKHPPPLNDVTPLDLQHKIIGLIALLIFILTFIPVPISIR
ncbi:site-2 protease family protein [candidate division WOR-3 bacterium]|nr:site-2 protease family protein [candidate division WOR-3 bacterium]